MHTNRKGLQFSRRDVYDYSTLTSVVARWLEKFIEVSRPHPFSHAPHYYVDNNGGNVDIAFEKWMTDLQEVLNVLQSPPPAGYGEELHRWECQQRLARRFLMTHWEQLWI